MLFADSAVAAGLVLRSRPVQVLFTPPDGAGYGFREMLALLRGGRGNRSMPVILAGAELNQRDVVEAIKAGVRGVLPLPAQPEALRTLLKELAEPAAAGSAQGEPSRRKPGKLRRQAGS